MSSPSLVTLTLLFAVVVLLPFSKAVFLTGQDITFGSSCIGRLDRGPWICSDVGPQTNVASFSVLHSQYSSVNINAVVEGGRNSAVEVRMDGTVVGLTTQLAPNHDYVFRISVVGAGNAFNTLSINSIELVEAASGASTAPATNTSALPSTTLPVPGLPLSTSSLSSTSLINSATLATTLSTPATISSAVPTATPLAPSLSQQSTRLGSGLPVTLTGNPSGDPLTAASDASNSGQPNSSAIVGAVFGVLILITLLIFAFFFYRRRQIRKRVAPSTAFMNLRSTTEQPPSYPFSRTNLFRRSRFGAGGVDAWDAKDRILHPYGPGYTGPAAAAVGATYGATAFGGARLGTLDEKSTEDESLRTVSALQYQFGEDPTKPIYNFPKPEQPLNIQPGHFVPSTFGAPRPDAPGAPLPPPAATAGANNAARGLSLDSVRNGAHTPPSSTSNTFGFASNPSVPIPTTNAAVPSSSAAVTAATGTSRVSMAGEDPYGGLEEFPVPPSGPTLLPKSDPPALAPSQGSEESATHATNPFNTPSEDNMAGRGAFGKS